jgi:hypothetical protein
MLTNLVDDLMNKEDQQIRWGKLSRMKLFTKANFVSYQQRNNKEMVEYINILETSGTC